MYLSTRSDKMHGMKNNHLLLVFALITFGLSCAPMSSTKEEQSPAQKEDLEFPAASITKHPTKSYRYLAAPWGDEGDSTSYAREKANEAPPDHPPKPRFAAPHG